VTYNIIEELSTSSTRNAHVLTLFESSRKMVLKIAEKVDTWMQRSTVDIQTFEGQGYDYGLRMLTAFARVVGQCFQAHENTMSESVRDQKKQAESLRQWNRIALHRCRCEACLHLKQINKHHLASLPLWLCEEYASGQLEIDGFPHFVRDRRKSLTQLFSNDSDKPRGSERVDKTNDSDKPRDSERVDKTIKLYRAPLFCFWPHCRDYEIEKIEVPHKPKPEKDRIEKYRDYVTSFVKTFLLERSQKRASTGDNRYEFIVSIHCNGDDVAARSIIWEGTKAEKQKAAAQATTFDVIIMRPSKEAEDRHRDLRWIKLKKVVDPDKSYVVFNVEMPIPESELDEFKYLCYLKEVSESTRFNVSARVGIILASAAEANIKFRDVNFDSVLDSFRSASNDVCFVLDHTDGLGHGQSTDENAPSTVKEEYVAVAFAQADQVWQMNKLLLLLDLIKRNRVLHEQKSKGFDFSWFRSKVSPSIPSKYNYLVKTFLQFLHSETPNVSEGINITEWKLGCVEYLREQSIAFMSELQQHVGAEDNRKQSHLKMDKTDIALGPLEHQVEQELALIADLKKSKDGVKKIATVSECSIRRGLDHGRTVEEITEFLTKTVKTPITQQLWHFIAVAKFNFNRDRYEACQDTIAHFMGKIKIVYTTLGVRVAFTTPGDEVPFTENAGSVTLDFTVATAIPVGGKITLALPVNYFSAVDPSQVNTLSSDGATCTCELTKATGDATTDIVTCTTAGAVVAAGSHTLTLIKGAVTTGVLEAASTTRIAFTTPDDEGPLTENTGSVTLDFTVATAIPVGGKITLALPVNYFSAVDPSQVNTLSSDGATCVCELTKATGGATTDIVTCTTAGAVVTAGSHTLTLIKGAVTTGVLEAASTTANDAAAAVVAAHDGAGIGQAADSKSTVKVETNSVATKTKQSVKRILDPNIEVAILQR
jgi:hypothetical protein